jgi:hypothetical protein
VIDLHVEAHGSVALLTPLTDAERGWVDANLAVEPWQWLGAALAIEPHCVDALVEGAVDAGLEVEP